MEGIVLSWVRVCPGVHRRAYARVTAQFKAYT